jgi:hypothetical protein
MYERNAQRKFGESQLSLLHQQPSNVICNAEMNFTEFLACNPVSPQI